MSLEKRLENLFERIRFLRDRRRFYEGLGLAVIGLYGVAIGVRDLMLRFFTAALGVPQRF